MFETVINILARVIEGVAALLIVGAVVAGVIDLVACFWREGFQGRTAGTRLRLAERLVHSIEFLIAADILKTIVTPTLERIGLVAGVILIRTVPSLSIAYELRGADGKEPAGPKPQHPVSANPATERGRSPEIEPGNFRGEGEELRSYIHKPSESAHPPPIPSIHLESRNTDMTTTLIRKHSLLLAAGTALSIALGTAVFAQSGQPGGQPGSQPPPGVDPATHARHVQQGSMGVGGVGGATNAMPSMPPAGSDAQPSDEYTDLVYQIAQLRAQVAQLQGVLAQRPAAQPMQPGTGGAGGTPSGMGMKNKPMGAGMQGQMGKAQPDGMAGMRGGGGASGAGGAGGGMKDDQDMIGMMKQMMGKMDQMMGGMGPGGAASPTQPAAGGMGMKSKPMGAGMQGQMGESKMGGMSGMKGMQPKPAASMPPAPPAPTAQPGGMAGTGGASGSAGGMKDNDMAMMGMMKQMMGKMDQMMGMGAGGAAPRPPAGGAPAAPMMDDDMDMMGMGGAAPMQPGAGAASGMANMPMLDKMQAKGMSRMGVGMNTGSAACGLAGFPGASHIYHIGATGFFLDHAMHITLTVEQQKQLGEIRVQSLFNQATFQRKVDQAEQDLMELTCSEAPDGGKVEYKAREIGQLQAEQRIAFIRDVGSAASVLTDEQRQQLTGMIEPNPAPQAQPPQPGAMPGMPGM